MRIWIALLAASLVAACAVQGPDGDSCDRDGGIGGTGAPVSCEDVSQMPAG